MLRIFRLQAADPAEVAAILQAVFAPTGPTITSGRPVSRPGAGAAETRIVSDPRSRALIVRTARAEDLEAIETILKEIDVPVR
jgi:type II secretory pathway component GspD/PulD (secretin)